MKDNETKNINNAELFFIKKKLCFDLTNICFVSCIRLKNYEEFFQLLNKKTTLSKNEIKTSIDSGLSNSAANGF